MEFSGTGSHFLTPECPALLLACPGQALHQQNGQELSLPTCRRPHPDAPPGGRVETGMAWAGPSWVLGPLRIGLPYLEAVSAHSFTDTRGLGAVGGRGHRPGPRAGGALWPPLPNAFTSLIQLTGSYLPCASVDTFSELLLLRVYPLHLHLGPGWECGASVLGSS